MGFLFENGRSTKSKEGFLAKNKVEPQKKEKSSVEERERKIKIIIFKPVKVSQYNDLGE